MILRYLNLPSDFIFLLKSDMNTRGAGFKILKSNFWNSGSISSLVKNCFVDIDELGRFDRIIHSLGWLGFRDRLASAYVEYELTGHFPKSPNLRLIDEVLTLEDYLKPYTIDGHGRGFLLGFYLRLHMCREQRTNPDFEIPKNLISEDIINLFDVGQSKVLPIDWIGLTLHLLSQYKRVDYLKDGLSQSMTFQDFLTDLPPSDKEDTLYNLVTYGASIEDKEMFFSEVV